MRVVVDYLLDLKLMDLKLLAMKWTRTRQKLTKNYKADIIYVTAFLNRPKFIQFVTETA